MRYYFFILCFWFTSQIALATNEGNVFQQLASYDVESAKNKISTWAPEDFQDSLLKATASAYIKLLEGELNQSLTDIWNISNSIEGLNQVNPQVAIYADRTAGLIHYMNGNLDSAYLYYWPSLLLIRENYGVRSTIYFDQLSLVIQLFESQGKLNVAEEMLITQLGNSKRLYGKRHPKTIQIIAHLGHLNTLMARFDVAQGYFDECNKLLENNIEGDNLAKSWSLIYQSNYYLTKGNFTVAESLNKQGLKILEENFKGYHPAKVFSYHLEAQIYIAMNDLREAGVKLSALVTYQNKYLGKEHATYSASLLLLADVLMKSDNMDQANKLIEKTESIVLKESSDQHVYYCDYLVLKARSLAPNDLESAKTYFQKAISTLETRYGSGHFYLADALSQYASFLYTNDLLKPALTQELRALEIRTSLFDFYHPDYTASIFSIAKIHLKANNTKEAAVYLKKGAENYIIQYNKYFAFLSEYEKGHFYARTNAFFDLYNHFALFESPLEDRQYWINQVFNYRLLTKALLFQSVKDLKEAIHQLEDPQLSLAYNQWIQAKENLSKLNKLDQRFLSHGAEQKDSLLELTNELEKRINLKIAISKNTLKEASQLNWQALSDQLLDDEMAMEMVRLKDFDLESGEFTDSIRYVCLAINNKMTKGPKAVVLMNGNELEEKHLKTYRNIIKYKVKDTRSYKTFLQPILDKLGNQMRSEIYFSPDGVYNQVNLNTFLDPENDKYFIDEYHVHIISSLRDLIDNENTDDQTAKHDNTFYFFGYPVYEHHPITDSPEKPKSIALSHTSDERGIHFQIRNMIGRGAEITMLPGTLEEVNTASDIIEDHVDHKVITGEEATEESVKNLQKPGLLHIATHGFFLPGDDKKSEPYISDDLSEILMTNATINPLFSSGIMLAGSAHAYDSLVIQSELDGMASGDMVEDGIMTSYEAMNIDLRGTELVILSACETGLGKVKSGEGVYGLQRAFQTAGANAVVISLWKVSDNATKDLMTLFYQNYVSGIDARNAFTKAQKELRTKYSEPYYWGAFVFVGKPSRNRVSELN